MLKFGLPPSSRRLGYLAGAASILAIAMGSGANAQTAATASNPTANGAGPAPGNTAANELVITGTQIRGVAPVGSPVISVGQADIQETGQTTTSDIIHDLPQVSNVGPSQSTSSAVQNANQNVDKSNTINIRGIGNQATLTLIDGRRAAPAGSGAALFDPSSIPTIALGRIEIVADGASATYGSDAVAGVANLTLRKNFDGLELDGNIGGADGGYYTQTVGGIFGKKWSGGSFMVAAEYNANSQLLQSARAGLFQCNQVPYGAATTSCSSIDAPANVVAVAGVGASSNGLASGTYGLPGGSGVGVTASQLSTTINHPAVAIASAVDPQQQRGSLVYSGHQDLGDKLTVWSEGYYTARYYLYDGGAPSVTAVIPTTNPYYIPGFSKETASYSLINDTGPAATVGFSKGAQIAAGADYKLIGDWQVSAYVAHSWDTELRVTRDGVNSTAQAAALACTTPGICLNPFGDSGNTTATLDSFLGETRYTSSYGLDDLGVKLDGTVFHLPGGDAKIAIGGEVHEDKLQLYNTSDTQAADANPTQYTVTGDTSNKRTVGSLFGELVIPVVGPDNAIPGIQSLVLDIAGRYDHYSDFGGTTNPKFGLNWKPIDDLMVHASYGTSYRAPNVADNNPAGAAMYGATAGLSATSGLIPGHFVITELGGNANLKPETATTYSVGFDYTPHELHGAHVSVNYFNIDYLNIITTPGQSCGGTAAYATVSCAPYFVTSSAFTLATPAAASSVLTPAAFAKLVNSAVSQLYFTTPQPSAFAGAFSANSVEGILFETKQNAGGAKMQGLDLQADYRWNTPIGSWMVKGTGTYFLNYDYSLTPGAAFVNVVNTINNPLRFRARGQVSWNDNGFGANIFVNYENPYKIIAGLPNVTVDSNLPAAIQNATVAASATVDGSLIYRTGTQPSFGLAKNITFTLSAQNMFNAKPPFALTSGSTEYDSANVNPLGRVVSFDVRKSF